MNLSGKTILITGAGGALGSHMVRQALDAGAEVVALDKNPAALAELPTEGITAVSCDVTDPVALEEMFAELFTHYSIDILINNAGILHSAPLVNMLSKDVARFANAASVWQEVIEANLSSVFYVTQLIADHMGKKRIKGVIVNISSVAAQGTPGQSAYAASKAGINTLTQVWGRELGALGIRTVAVAPGYMDTPSTHKAVPEAQLKAVTDRVPLKKLGAPEHIWQAVRFVVENDYINGTVLEVDGGFTP